MAQLKDLIVNGPSRFIGDVYATTFTGNLEGNASTATSATNAGMIAGLSVHSGRNNEANKIVRTDGNGYLQVGYINSSSGHEKNASNPTYVWGSNSSDSYLRSYQTSSLSVSYATTARSCSGNSATATKATQDGNGNVITSTYLPLSGGTMSNTNVVTNLNADFLDGYNASSFAKVASANNLISFGNEFNFVPSAFTGSVWFNYRTVGDTNGGITRYTFGDGKGGSLATITKAQFSGNAASSSKWETARTITLTGSVTGSVSIDGSGDVSLATTTNHTHSYAGSSTAGGDATRALAIADYGDTTRTIQIGYAGTGLSTSNLTHIAGYTNGGAQIKDVSKSILQSWLGLGSAAYTNSDAYAPGGWSVFSPSGTQYTNADVLAKTGNWSIRKGIWYFADNGYVESDFGKFELAGTSILSFGDSSVYTQLFITPPATSSTNGITNEMLFYNNHGSSYNPGWTRVLTNRNYSSYALPLSGGTLSGNLTIKKSSSNVPSPLIIDTNSTLGVGLSYTTSTNYAFRVEGGDSYFDGNVVTDSDFSSRGNAIIDGCVGIGTQNPSYRLDVKGDVWVANGNISLKVRNTRDIYFISADAYNGLLAITSGSRPSNPAFLMSNSGYIYLNCDSPRVPAYPLVVEGIILCTTLLQTSDIKYKTNIKQIEYEEALKIIENLNPVTWDWNENTIVTGSSSGFVAQEAEEFIPNAISRDNENNLSLDYTQLHSYEIRVIQEQQKEIIKLKEKLKILEKLIS